MLTCTCRKRFIHCSTQCVNQKAGQNFIKLKQDLFGLAIDALYMPGFKFF